MRGPDGRLVNLPHGGATRWKTIEIALRVAEAPLLECYIGDSNQGPPMKKLGLGLIAVVSLTNA